jgi:hypothetical protein
MQLALDTDALELAKLASDASIRALAEQERALRDLQAQAAALLAASSLVVTFLGGQAIARGGLGPAAWLAMAMFLGGLGTTLSALQPDPRVGVGLDGTAIHLRMWPAAGDLADLHRGCTLWIDEIRQLNEPVVRRRLFVSRCASVALVAQSVLWVVQLAL